MRSIYNPSGLPVTWVVGGEDDDERRVSENELDTCCHGRNINCGHHYGRS